MELDFLEKLEPKPATLTMGGKSFLVYPAKIKKMIQIEKFYAELDTMGTDEAIKQALVIIESSVENYKELDLDFTPQQLFGLVRFIHRGLTEQAELEAELKEPAKGAKKKGS